MAWRGADGGCAVAARDVSRTECFSLVLAVLIDYLIANTCASSAGSFEEEAPCFHSPIFSLRIAYHVRFYLQLSSNLYNQILVLIFAKNKNRVVLCLRKKCVIKMRLQN